MCTAIALFPWMFLFSAFAVLAIAAFKRERLRRALGSPAKLTWSTMWLLQPNAFGPEHEPVRRQIAWRVVSGMCLLVMVGVSLAVRNNVCVGVP